MYVCLSLYIYVYMYIYIYIHTYVYVIIFAHNIWTPQHIIMSYSVASVHIVAQRWLHHNPPRDWQQLLTTKHECMSVYIVYIHIHIHIHMPIHIHIHIHIHMPRLQEQGQTQQRPWNKPGKVVSLLRVLESNFPADPLSNSTDMRIPTL